MVGFGQAVLGATKTLQDTPRLRSQRGRGVYFSSDPRSYLLFPHTSREFTPDMP
jgi:hypothetical protein